MKKAAIGFVAMFALAGTPVLAADMATKGPMPAPAPMTYSWTGIYVGLDGGYAWGNSRGQNLNAAAVPGTGPAYNFDINGGFGGGLIGAQFQWQNWVVGVEGDYQAANITGNSPATLVGAVSYTVATRVNSYESIRGRLGYAWDRWLVFGTGGWADAQFSTSVAFTGFPPFWTNSPDKQGWTAGGGVSYAVLQNVFVTLEYRYTRLNAAGGGPVTGVNSSEAGNVVKINDVRGGFALKF